jgi:fructose-1,6-bisphosphatase/inositol monophosphatase family enzyme
VLIVEEAGGIATDANGGTLSFNGPDPFVQGVLCATWAQHALLLELSRSQAMSNDNEDQ